MTTVVRSAIASRASCRASGSARSSCGSARELSLTGAVGNDSAGVFVEVEGGVDAIDEFATRLVRERPPLARVDSVDVEPVAPLGSTTFEIVASEQVEGGITLVPPDVATCDDCLADIADPANRRYRYPFTNCTNCGPRFTIIRDLPYDRPNTTMAGFEMCDACAGRVPRPH